MKKEEVLIKINAALELVAALCKPRGTAGAREWMMSIPARPDYDPDIVIADALYAAKHAVENRESCERLMQWFKRVRAVAFSRPLPPLTFTIPDRVDSILIDKQEHDFLIRLRDAVYDTHEFNDSMDE